MLRFVSLNIAGNLHEKIHTTCIRSIIANHDLAAFTHTGSIPIGRIGGFKCIHLPRPHQSQHGGVAIMMKDGLASHSHVIRKHAESGILWVGIALPNRRPISLAVCYLPPHGSTYYSQTGISMASHFDTLRADVAEFSVHSSIIMCGDFNARTGSRSDILECDWADMERVGLPVVEAGVSSAPMAHRLPPRRTCDRRTVNAPGERLLELCQSSQLVILNGRLPGDMDVVSGGAFTFRARGRQGRSLIDYFIASPELAFNQGGKGLPMSSLRVAAPYSLTCETDHAYVSLALPVPVTVEHVVREGGQDQTPRYKYRPEVTEAFLDALSHRQAALDSIAAGEHVCASDALLVLNSVLCEALRETHAECGGVLSVPGTQRKAGGRPQNQWYDEECIASRRVWKRAQQKFGPVSAQAMDARKRYRATTRRVKCAFEEGNANNLVRRWLTDPKGFWRVYKGGKGSCALTNVQTWAEYFDALLNDTGGCRNDADPMHTHYPPPTDAMVHQAKALNISITEEEVWSELERMKFHKAPGVDGIQAEFLVCSAVYVVPVITRVFNAILKHEYPVNLGTSVLVPILKSKGDPHVHDNYRGIAVGPAIGKLFSMILNTRADEWAETNGYRAKGQFGFRKARSTVDAAFVLLHAIEQYKANHKPLFCAFIDFKKAYDSVDRDTLWQCLASLGMHGDFLRCLQGMYSDVRMCVRIGSNISGSFTARTGVKQGDPLSPLLFGLFIDCLERFLSARCGTQVGARVAGQILRVLLYADDLVLMGETVEELQALLNHLAEFCQACKMSVNISKSEVVCFNGESARHAQPYWTYAGATLPVVDEFKYLGILFTNTRSGSCVAGACNRQQKCAHQALHAMWRKCYSLRITNVRTLCYLFDTLVRSIASYGCEVWGPRVIARVDMHNLGKPHEMLQNMFLRQALGVRSSTPIAVMLSDMGREPMWMFWIRQGVKFWNRTIMLPDQDLIRSCVCESVLMATSAVAVTECWAHHFIACMQRLGVIRSHDDLILKNPSGSWQLRPLPVKQLEAALKRAADGSWVGAPQGSPRQIPDSRHEGFKLTTYSYWFKHTSVFDKRVAFSTHLNDRASIMAVARFRMGSHNLNVESLRWSKVRVPRSQRVCRCCSSGIVEDEMHIMMECTMYDDLRSDYMWTRDITVESANMKMMVDCQSGEQWNAFATYIRACFKRRTDYLNSLEV